MPSTLVVPLDRLPTLQRWVAEQGLPVAVLAGAPASDEPWVRVEQGDRSQRCEPTLLVAGGRISCPVALGMAKRLGLPALGLGALLDELEIKVGSCSLGCF